MSTLAPATDHPTGMLAAALDLVGAGWAVFPLTGKAPRTRRGFHDATCDPEQIRAWWSAAPGANIGGAIPGGLLVLDIDPRNGGDATIGRLQRTHGPLPDTLTVITGRGDGGRHLYLRRPPGPVTGARTPGVDVKVSGYMVLPPSTHPDTATPYRWLDPAAPIAAPPRWFVRLLRPVDARPNLEPRQLPSGSDRYGLAALAAEAASVAGTTTGGRNHALNRAAFKAGQLVAAGLLSDDDVRTALMAAADTCGLLADDGHAVTLRTIRSGLRAGQARPRAHR
ncbi:bifunctional DNA primase/polymerase [Kineosporia sp. A_224]|uniref:bifunctional DNA primase/polymerase n=1 Tax=Kineosporia sp. A_224 TaxID=1962180 RepID=UPI0013045C07|nr:bifunctional DNA primase/polymerase [Kineosporia sp. A_224]